MLHHQLHLETTSLVVVEGMLPPVTHDVLGKVDSDNLRTMCSTVFTNVLNQWPAQVTVGRADDAQGQVNVLADPVQLELRGGELIDGHVHGFDGIVTGCNGVVDGLENGLLHLADQHDGVVTLSAEGGLCIHRYFSFNVAVIPVHTNHEGVQNGHCQEDNPCTMSELSNCHDDENGCGESSTGDVDQT